VVTLDAAGPAAVRPTLADVDADLVDGLRRGAADAADELVERYGARVYRLALRITGVKEDAEEAAQDVLLTAARKIQTFKGESQFRSWIYRITANAAYLKLRVRRRKANEIALEDVLPQLDGEGRHFEPMDDWSNRVDERALQGELRQVLTNAIEALPAHYRTALVLHDVDGLSNPEIAETLGVSLPAVKSRVHRSRLFVRKRLAEYLGGASRPPALERPTG
jgi:RNA polymerase sigma-70 factor (ECF subfamily)